MIKLRSLPHKLAKLSRIATLLLCTLLCIHAPNVLADGPASDITDDEANSINAKTPYFSFNQWQCANSANITPTPSAGSGPAQSTKPVIVIDPGHSGKDNNVVDPQSGLDDHDYPNIPEINDVFAVSQLVQQKLTADGYQVLLTKNAAMDTVTFRERANIANNANAALAISIHDQAGNPGGLQFGSFSQIYPQKVGEYRQNSGHKVTFTNADVATKSQQYAQTFQQTRSQAEGTQTVVKDNSFDGRPGIDAGNLSMVQLFSNVPWVYNEVGGNSAGQTGLSVADEQKFAAGLVAGVEKSIPVSGGSASSTASATGTCSGSCTSTTDVNAADALKQTTMDPRFQALILQDAAQAGADPIAMAALLFWEHRSFPPYGAGSVPGESDTNGRGPWQITSSSWPSSAGNYATGVYDPVIATKVAAGIVAAYGGVQGMSLGSIDQDFSKGSNIKSMATVAKNYNAGQATWRQPGVATWNQAGRQWMEGTRGPWSGNKPKIIDDYIVGMTYAYYQIATGQKITYQRNDSYVQEGIAHENDIKGFKRGTGGTVDAGNCDISGNGAVAGSIVKTALGYAWDTTGHGRNKADAKPSFQTDNVDGTQADFPYSDCGAFVATVLIKSGVDPNYPPRGTTIQLPYLEKHPDKYQMIDGITNTSQLQPGDILITSRGMGHTYIYTGNYPDGATPKTKTWNSAGASLGGHVPEATNFYQDDGGQHFVVARLKS